VEADHIEHALEHLNGHDLHIMLTKVRNISDTGKSNWSLS
jgi:hypothetical protein